MGYLTDQGLQNKNGILTGGQSFFNGGGYLTRNTGKYIEKGFKKFRARRNRKKRQ